MKPNRDMEEDVTLLRVPRSVNKRPWKIISGGQTGVDRAGLVAAMSYCIPFGGWVPKGRLAEDGAVPENFYALRECDGGYRERTRANVDSADATLILVDSFRCLAERHTRPNMPPSEASHARPSTSMRKMRRCRYASGCFRLKARSFWRRNRLYSMSRARGNPFRPASSKKRRKRFSMYSRCSATDPAATSARSTTTDRFADGFHRTG